jgi:hypothetical protein
LIKPKVTATDSTEEGFLSALASLYSDYPLAMSFLSLILIVGLVGVVSTFRNSNNRVVLTNDDSEGEILDAEIFEGEVLD